MTEQNTEPAAVEEETPPPGEAGTGETEGAEDAATLKKELEERTDDLKRVTAEYANYRKRVERDRKLVADQAVISVVTGMLPVLDDLDRARSHGDLTGPFGSVAEQLTGALAKLGLTAFGEKGDPFDPNRHEAVAHMLSPEVTEPTCIDVMRRGYELGDRLVRAALVAVADPAEEAPAAPAAEEKPAEAAPSEEGGEASEEATVGEAAEEAPKATAESTEDSGGAEGDK